MRIIYVANTDWALYNFRLSLIKSVIEQGWETLCFCKYGDFKDHLYRAGIKDIISLKKYQKGIHPISDFTILYDFYRLYKKWKPDIVHHFTIKPVIYGSIGAYLAKVPIIVNTITGLGYVFTEEDRNRHWIKIIATQLYKICSKVSDFFFFQNKEDRNFFIYKNLIKEKKTDLISGSGVNIHYFDNTQVDPNIKNKLKMELGLQNNDLVVMLISRMLYDKGIVEFVECATRLKKKEKGLRFFLVGPLAPGNPAQIPLEVIQKWTSEEKIEYLGRRTDIRELIAIADIITLPSYREGMPRILLEAASMGKPIVTTDTVGCRDVVKHGKHGLLVPIKDIDSLSDALTILLKNPELRKKLGKNSRERAVSEFDEKIVINKTLEIYKILIKRNLKKG